MMKPFSGPKFRENEKRCRSGAWPCAYCGKAIKDNSTAVQVFICCDLFNPEGGYEAHKNHGSCMNYYPLGPDCAKRLKTERRGSVLATAAKALSR